MRNYSLRFEKLWIEDVTYHEINVLCSKYTLHQVYISHFDQLDELLQARMSALLAQWAPGLEIMSIRFTKPDLPAAIRESYELVDEEKIKLLVGVIPCSYDFPIDGWYCLAFTRNLDTFVHIRQIYRGLSMFTLI
ncbi:hypothetical protein AaE_009569 [Aphanomyces astaci]|uniref:Band 7 domain-containing protein n=1 Tax=Aphanomyces astaci TaxID=112090 RepID=A0A6A5AC21_APHAT|nr:hypothetical protein AaE_009569 [Aphanomyces astaci]